MVQYLLENAILPVFVLVLFVGSITALILAVAMTYKFVQAIRWWFR